MLLPSRKFTAPVGLMECYAIFIFVCFLKRHNFNIETIIHDGDIKGLYTVQKIFPNVKDGRDHTHIKKIFRKNLINYGKEDQKLSDL